MDNYKAYSEIEFARRFEKLVDEYGKFQGSMPGLLIELEDCIRAESIKFKLSDENNFGYIVSSEKGLINLSKSGVIVIDHSKTILTGSLKSELDKIINLAKNKIRLNMIKDIVWGDNE